MDRDRAPYKDPSRLAPSRGGAVEGDALGQSLSSVTTPEVGKMPLPPTTPARDPLGSLQHALAALDDAKILHPKWIFSDAQKVVREAIAHVTPEASGSSPEVLRAMRYGLAALDEIQKDHPRWIYSDAQASLRGAIAEALQLEGAPVAAIRIECNTFEFYVEATDHAKMVTTRVHTTFEGGSLEEDFPNGSPSEFRGLAPLGMTDIQAVNHVAPHILEAWEPLAEPSVEAPAILRSGPAEGPYRLVSVLGQHDGLREVVDAKGRALATFDGGPNDDCTVYANARLFASSWDMNAFLQEALSYEAEAFDADESVSGADLVDFFAAWRERVKDFLAKNEGR